MARDAFQTSVSRFLAPGVKGGWASANPHVSLLPPTTGDLTDGTNASWRVGATGAIVGQFAFADTVTGLVTSANPGTGAIFTEGAAGSPGRVRFGFVQRDQVALITTYLDGDASVLFSGQGITLLSRGDVWALFAAGAAMGSFVFASFADGSAIAGATSTAPTTTYSLTTTSGSAAITGVGAGAAVGQPVTGTGIPAGTYIATLSGTTGTLSQNATASGTITGTATTAVLTPWRTDSLAANGDIAKISVWG